MTEPAAEPCKTLAEALAQLQARLPRVAKASEGQVGPRTYKYADLADVSDALLPLMASVGLSFSAKPTLEDGAFVLRYELRHVSGESDLGRYPLPASGTPQQVGSAITYARRYTLCAVTGLAPGGDDDDAQAAEQAHRAPRNIPDAQLAAEGRMTRQQAREHDQLAADTKRGGKVERSHPRAPDPDDPWAQDAPVDHERGAGLRQAIADGRAEAEDRPGSSNSRQHQQLGILYSQIGITERETRLAEMTDRVGREIGSAKDLSYTEAEQAIRQLRELAAREAETSEKGAN
jgi:hypothetical protein